MEQHGRTANNLLWTTLNVIKLCFIAQRQLLFLRAKCLVHMVQSGSLWQDFFKTNPIKLKENWGLTFRGQTT